VNGLAADPHRGERFASYELNSNHCIVKVFDVRKPGVESVSFKVDGSVVALEWLDNGRLATGSRENGVSVWDIINGRREEQGGAEDWVTLGGMRQRE
jgi:WD40 repeat protein